MLCRHTSDVLLRFPEAFSFGRMSRQGLFSRGGCIPAQRNLLSGIIFQRRKHPCSKKSPVRDYFPETKASLLEEIPRQGLFSQNGSIPARRNPPSGIIFPRRKHPCSEKSLFKDYFPETKASLLKKSTARDYFPEAKASLLGEIPFQGLFSRGKSIPAQRNPPPGIIFPRRKHPCSEKSPVRDYFPEAKASLFGEIPFQGLFFRCGCIPARRNPFSGIIFPRRKHPCSEKSPARDYFPEADASPGHSFSICSCHPRLALCPQSYTDLSRTRRTQANVYQSYLIRRRTASFASSAAPEAGAVIPSCAPHYGRNLPVFFPERG